MCQRRQVILIIVVILTALCSCQRQHQSDRVESDHVHHVTQFIEIVNAYREKIGCHPLIWNQAIAKVAQSHSQDMGLNQYRSHTTLDNKTIENRLRKLGLTAWGENIAWGLNYDNAETVFNVWLNSPSHRNTMENCTYTDHGIGIYKSQDQYIWTHDFGRPQQ